jgi:hypothetical protein
MGYSFHIGNAVHDIYEEDGEKWESWPVAGTTHPDAPTFPHDEMTGNGNGRHPSYSGWSAFCKDAGIYEFFYTESGHLKCGHPGTMFITYDDLAVIQLALEARKNIATKPPGFDGYPVLDKNGQYSSPDQGKYDGTLARLIWLEFWMRWALENCETPGIQNT